MVADRSPLLRLHRRPATARADAARVHHDPDAADHERLHGRRQSAGGRLALDVAVSHRGRLPVARRRRRRRPDGARTLAAAVEQPAGTAIGLETRTGNTPTPDASWSDYQAVGAGGAIQSPSARYIQYRALLSTSDRHVTPSLLRTDLIYDIDRNGPVVVLEPVRVRRPHTATVRFASKALDTVGYHCSLDGAVFASCNSPRRLTGLRSGTHRISVRAIDRLGNVGPAVTNRFKVGGKDRTKPRAMLSARSTRMSSRGTIAFRVRCPSSEERCKVALRLKHGAALAGRATVKVKGGRAATATVHLARAARADGAAHPTMRVTLVVAATDAAGNKRTTTRRITLRGAG